VLRKTDAVTDRVTDIENYKLALLRNLHLRYVSVDSGGGKLVAYNGDSKLPLAEQDAMKLFKNRFRVASYEEPPVFDVDAYYCGIVSQMSAKPPLSRWGHLYVTQRQVFFHADANIAAAAASGMIMGMFSSSWGASSSGIASNSAADEMILVFPILTIVSFQTEASGQVGSDAAGADAKYVFMTDVSGSIHVFLMPSGSPHQFASRVCDLLSILRSCATGGYDLATASATAHVPAINNGTDRLVTPANISKGYNTSLSGPSSQVGVPSVSSAQGKQNSLAATSTGNSLAEGETAFGTSIRAGAFSHVLNLASSAVDSAAALVRPTAISQSNTTIASGNKYPAEPAIPETKPPIQQVEYNFLTEIDAVLSPGGPDAFTRSDPHKGKAGPGSSLPPRRESSSLGKSIQVRQLILMKCRSYVLFFFRHT
jgi:hypothetical protein